MDAPDVLVDAVAEVLWNGDSEPFISWANLAEPVKEMQRDAARRILAVPAVADALERDRKVAVSGDMDEALESDLLSEMATVIGHDDASRDLATDVLAAIGPYIARLDADAARLRSLAHHFDLFDNRDKSYTGAQVAAMLRDGEG